MKGRRTVPLPHYWPGTACLVVKSDVKMVAECKSSHRSQCYSLSSSEAFHPLLISKAFSPLQNRKHTGAPRQFSKWGVPHNIRKIKTSCLLLKSLATEIKSVSIFPSWLVHVWLLSRLLNPLPTVHSKSGYRKRGQDHDGAPHKMRRRSSCWYPHDSLCEDLSVKGRGATHLLRHRIHCCWCFSVDAGVHRLVSVVLSLLFRRQGVTRSVCLSVWALRTQSSMYSVLSVWVFSWSLSLHPFITSPCSSPNPSK